MRRARRHIGDPTTRAPTIVQIVALLAIAAVFPARGISAQACPAGLHALNRVQAVFAGHRHTCSIAADAHGEQSALYCWGGNDKGMLGTPDREKRSSPTYVNNTTFGSAVKISALSVLLDSTCAMVAAGSSHKLHCWGTSPLLTGEPLSTSTYPAHITWVSTSLEDGVSPIELRAGQGHVCVLAFGNSTGVYCAGLGVFGQLGLNSTVSTPNLSRVSFLEDAGHHTAIAAGDTHTCAITSGGQRSSNVYCWGSFSGTERTFVPTRVPGLDAIQATAIAAGGAFSRHTCIMATGGSSPLYCWGDNTFGQLGLGPQSIFENPTPVPLAGITPKSLVLGAQTTCIISAHQQIHCVGRNQYGQLGLSDKTDRKRFSLLDRVSLAPGVNATAVAAGGGHMCAILQGEELTCWGANGLGQLGRASIGVVDAGDLRSPCACPADRYMNSSDLTCRRCPQNASAHMGSDDISDCECRPGFTGQNGKDCAPCVGSFKATSGSGPCINCAAGTFSAAVGATVASTCADCGAGTYAGASAATVCTNCSAGQHKASAGINTACDDCAAGKHKAAAGVNTECDECEAGKYSEINASTVCTNCTAGTYIPQENGGGSACTKCAAGTYSGSTAQTSSAACTKCASGKYSSLGASACIDCTAGTYSAAAASACSNCTAGTYAGSTAQTVCTKCAAGKYSSVNASTVCTDCVAGKVSAAEGASAASTCDDCGAGKYSTASGATAEGTCSACTANSDAPAGSDAASDCVCNSGYASDGADVCVACGAGTFKAGSGNEACTDCGAGTYSTSNHTECSACTKHSSSPPKSNSPGNCTCNVSSSLRCTHFTPCN